MSQSPLSRAIRELERELGLVLFVRTTRRVELTPGRGRVARARAAGAGRGGAGRSTTRGARRSPSAGVVAIGYGPFSRSLGDADRRRAGAAAARSSSCRLEEDVAPELVAAGRGARACRRSGARDAGGGTAPRCARRCAAGRAAAGRAAGGAPVRRRGRDSGRRVRGRVRAAAARAARASVQRVAACGGPGGRVRARADAGDAERSVGSAHAARSRAARPSRVFVAEWAQEPIAGVVGGAVRSAAELPDRPRDAQARRPTARNCCSRRRCDLRDAEGWLTRRPARTELPRRLSRDRVWIDAPIGLSLPPARRRSVAGRPTRGANAWQPTAATATGSR